MKPIHILIAPALISLILLFSSSCTYASPSTSTTPVLTPVSTPASDSTQTFPEVPPLTSDSASTKVKGYQLFYDGKLAGQEPNWGYGQAVDNFRWNTETYPDKKVTAFFDDEPLVYLQSVEVIPVFFIPSDCEDTAQEKYKGLLKGRDTFTISGAPVVYESTYDLSYFKKNGESGVAFAVELLQHFNVNRFNCPFIFVMVLMNPTGNFPAGGGIPFNGGLNTGGGIVIMSSFFLDRSGVSGNEGFQSTLQHELGHSFGLVHVDAYGYDMQTNTSIMSYNPDNNWKGLNPPVVEGTLIPEDVRALAVNKLVFPNLYFDADKDVPSGYMMSELTVLEEMNMVTDHFGYELFFDGQLVGHEPAWSSRKAIENLIGNISLYPDKKIEGKYCDKEITTSGIGYELYFDGERVGQEPNWDYNQAIGNLQGNRENHPDMEVEGVFNGRILP